MRTLLVINVSPDKTTSASRQLATEFTTTWLHNFKDYKVVSRDIGADPIPHRSTRPKTPCPDDEPKPPSRPSASIAVPSPWGPQRSVGANNGTDRQEAESAGRVSFPVVSCQRGREA